MRGAASLLWFQQLLLLLLRRLGTGAECCCTHTHARSLQRDVQWVSHLHGTPPPPPPLKLAPQQRSSCKLFTCTPPLHCFTVCSLSLTTIKNSLAIMFVYWSTSQLQQLWTELQRIAVWPVTRLIISSLQSSYSRPRRNVLTAIIFITLCDFQRFTFQF